MFGKREHFVEIEGRRRRRRRRRRMKTTTKKDMLMALESGCQRGLNWRRLTIGTCIRSKPDTVTRKKNQ